MSLLYSVSFLVHHGAWQRPCECDNTGSSSSLCDKATDTNIDSRLIVSAFVLTVDTRPVHRCQCFYPSTTATATASSWWRGGCATPALPPRSGSPAAGASGATATTRAARTSSASRKPDRCTHELCTVVLHLCFSVCVTRTSPRSGGGATSASPATGTSPIAGSASATATRTPVIPRFCKLVNIQTITLGKVSKIICVLFVVNSTKAEPPKFWLGATHFSWWVSG